MREDGTVKLSQEQAQAILDLRLQRLTALGRDEIGDDLKKLADEIKDYLETLSSRRRINRGRDQRDDCGEGGVRDTAKDRDYRRV